MTKELIQLAQKIVAQNDKLIKMNGAFLESISNPRVFVGEIPAIKVAFPAKETDISTEELDDFTEFGKFVEEQADSAFESLCTEDVVRKIIRETWKGSHYKAHKLVDCAKDELAKLNA